MNATNQSNRPAFLALAVAAALSALVVPVSATASDGSLATASRASTDHVRLPAVAEAVGPRVGVRRGPRAEAPRIATMNAIRFDRRLTVFFVAGSRTVDGETAWYRIKVPGRPNGRSGWVPARQLRLLRSVGKVRIVIDRGRRRMVLKRGGKTIVAAPVAVGTPDAPTPLGRFYVAARFAPADDFLGPWAFELSAYAAITDWPRGGIVGLHGTSEPWSIGRRASHGCIRTYNRVIRKLRHKVRVGTVIRIKR